jgi:hypothetical protein
MRAAFSGNMRPRRTTVIKVEASRKAPGRLLNCWAFQETRRWDCGCLTPAFKDDEAGKQNMIDGDPIETSNPDRAFKWERHTITTRLYYDGQTCFNGVGVYERE